MFMVGDLPTGAECVEHALVGVNAPVVRAMFVEPMADRPATPFPKWNLLRVHAMPDHPTAWEVPFLRRLIGIAEHCGIREHGLEARNLFEMRFEVVNLR